MRRWFPEGWWRSPWFSGPAALALTDPRQVPFVRVPGKLDVSGSAMIKIAI